MRDLLVQEGYDVFTSPTGEDGIEKVHKDKPDLVIIDLIMSETEGIDVCKTLLLEEGNRLMPIIMIAVRDDEKTRLTALELGVDDYMVKPFSSKEFVVRVKNSLRRIDRNRLASPLTGLPGSIAIQAEIARRIARKDLFVVLYGDLDNFKSYNDEYGFVKGDKVIVLTADVLGDNVRTYGNPNDFLGHIGGDDFVMVTTPDKVDTMCEGIIKDFDKKILDFYSDRDRKRGYIISKNRLGEIIKFPVVSISIAAVTNEKRRLFSVLQVAEIAAEVKKKAKALEGSAYVKDKRTN